MDSPDARATRAQTHPAMSRPMTMATMGAGLSEPGRASRPPTIKGLEVRQRHAGQSSAVDRCDVGRSPTLQDVAPVTSGVRSRRTIADARTEIRTLETLLDLLEEAVAANGDKTALSLRLDDGSTTRWSYRELERRSRQAAWRLHALGLEPGDRLLTWSPSTPDLPATYFGAMRAGLVIVPLDLRMSPDAIEGIVRASGARHLGLGTGRDAPDPREAGLDRFPTTTVDTLTADPDASFPADW